MGWLLHDYQLKLAVACVRVVAPLLREEEQVECVRQMADAIKPILEEYEAKADRSHRRVKGG